MDLPELLTLIEGAWEARWQQGRVTHVHRNYLQRPDGSYVHLRILIQTVDPPSKPPDIPAHLLVEDPEAL